MKKIAAIILAGMSSAALAAPEIQIGLDAGSLGSPDNLNSMDNAVKGVASPIRWDVAVRASDFTGITPTAIDLQVTEGSTTRTLKTIPVSADSFHDNTIRVCTFFGLICSNKDGKFVHGVDSFTPSLDTQSLKAVFRYQDANGAASKTGSLRVDTLERVCGDSSYSVGMKRYVPTGTAPSGGWPAVILMHGGFGKFGAPLAMDAYAQDLANNGYFVANLDYRLTPDSDRFTNALQVKYPTETWDSFKANHTEAEIRQMEASLINETGVQDSESIADVKCTIRQLRSQNASYGINPNKLALMGWSAGGRLALFAGLTSDGPVPEWENKGGNSGVATNVQAVVALSAPSQNFDSLLLSGALKTKEKCDFIAGLGFSRGNCFENATAPTSFNTDEAAILTRHAAGEYAGNAVNMGIPLLSINGANDTLVRVEANGQVLYDTLEQASQPYGIKNVHIKTYSNGIHDDFNGNTTGYARKFCTDESSALAVAFLNAYLKENGTSTAIQNFTTTLSAQANSCQ